MAKSAVPISVLFDDLMRHYDHYCNYSTESEFLDFVINQEECRKKWMEAERECTRLQNEVENAQAEISRQDKRIQEIRRHLENKMEILTKVEVEKEKIEVKASSARTLIHAYLNDGRISGDTKDKLFSVLTVLETGEYAKKTNTNTSNLRSPAGVLDTISEAGSTDLSMTQSEDDLDVSVMRSGRRRHKRPSMDNVGSVGAVMKRHRNSSTRQVMEINSTDHLIAKTVVSFPKDGSVQAVASLETVPMSHHESRTGYSEANMVLQPSAPPMPSSSETESDNFGWTGIAKHSPLTRGQSRRISTTFQMPTTTTSAQSPRFGRTLSSGGAMAIRPHAFCQKTVIKRETCIPCGKRIRFSKVALKCRDCKATCHPECRDKVPLPCVSTGTPVNKNQMGTVVDYAPSSHPMVPSLIQHCVNDIEIRGLDTVGLYRVPGPEKEVKDLKERFIKGKGVPNLGRYDIHAVCGCIKDFLRSLQEPLVGRWFWRDFALATDISDQMKRQIEIDRIIHELPPANQDTLAFMMLHLQKVAESPDVKMPIGNLAKVFGPTIVGYSGPDIDASTILKETKKQQMVLETLLTAPPEFWKKFVYRPQEQGKIYGSGSSGTYTKSKGKQLAMQQQTPSSTPHAQVGKIRESSKKIYFTDDSPNKHDSQVRQKRVFFD